jgi:hypothetical protein
LTERETEGEVFFRYMSKGEARAVGEAGEEGYLRGGRDGETHWTDVRYETAAEAKAHLSLARRPEVRMRFTILEWPSRMEKEGSAVAPIHGEPGGGLEWMTHEKVKVVVLDADELG